MEISGNENQKSRDEALDHLIQQVQNEKTKDYICSRIVPQLEWYGCKSREYKQKYQNATLATIILGALIPVVSVIANGNIWVKALLAAMGAGVTAVNAYLALNKFEELWTSYRCTRESLFRILYYYFNDAGIFHNIQTQKEKDVLLINTCEDLISKETSNWRAYQEKKNG